MFEPPRAQPGEESSLAKLDGRPMIPASARVPARVRHDSTASSAARAGPRAHAPAWSRWQKAALRPRGAARRRPPAGHGHRLPAQPRSHPTTWRLTHPPARPTRSAAISASVWPASSSSRSTAWLVRICMTGTSAAPRVRARTKRVGGPHVLRAGRGDPRAEAFRFPTETGWAPVTWRQTAYEGGLRPARQDRPQQTCSPDSSRSGAGARRLLPAAGVARGCSSSRARA